MLLSAVSVLVVAQSSSKIPEGLMNNPVFKINTQIFLANPAPIKRHSSWVKIYHITYALKFLLDVSLLGLLLLNNRPLYIIFKTRPLIFHPLIKLRSVMNDTCEPISTSALPIHVFKLSHNTYISKRRRNFPCFICTHFLE